MALTTAMDNKITPAIELLKEAESDISTMMIPKKDRNMPEMLAKLSFSFILSINRPTGVRIGIVEIIIAPTVGDTYCMPYASPRK